MFYKGNIKPLFKGSDLGAEGLNRWREDFPAKYRDGRPIRAALRRQARRQRHGRTQARGR